VFSWKKREIRFFKDLELPDEDQVKKAFGYAFIQVWAVLHVKDVVKPIREIYDYIKPILSSKKMFEDRVEKGLERFNPYV